MSTLETLGIDEIPSNISNRSLEMVRSLQARGYKIVFSEGTRPAFLVHKGESLCWASRNDSMDEAIHSVHAMAEEGAEK